MDWQALEKKVRWLASSKWGRTAGPKMINGIHFDCVLEINDRHWVLIEVTKSNTLSKLREDLAKFVLAAPVLLQDRIYTECFFISADRLSDELRHTADSNYVTAFTPQEFEGYVFNYQSYAHYRINKGFGSAVDPKTGEPDQRKYTSVTYRLDKDNSQIGLKDIAGMLSQGRSIILLGDYGTGKSRLVKELFEQYRESFSNQLRYMIAIDLRHCWGVKRGAEMVRRHFDDLGISQMGDDFLKLSPNGKITWLFDGFDELGINSWSSDQSKIEELRMEALAPFRELSSSRGSNFVVSGRPHYFNSDKEMLACLGVRKEEVVVVHCKEEFTENEMRSFFGDSTWVFPSWLPKRPLMASILGDSGQRQDFMENESDSEYKFWSIFFEYLSVREVGIQRSLDSQVWSKILTQLGRIARTKANDYGPLTQQEISDSYRLVVGREPDANSQQVLQRLPCLGRYEAESDNRVFVDPYILNGIKGEDIYNIVAEGERVTDGSWKHPTNEFGIRIAYNKFLSTQSASLILPYLRMRAKANSSGILNGDILALLLASEHEGPINCVIDNAHIVDLNLAERTIGSLTVRDSLIDNLHVGGESFTNVSFEGCIIKRVHGIGNISQASTWLHESNDIDQFDELTNSSSILHANLKPGQKILLIIIQRLFFQPGSGRKERALFRGLGEFKSDKIIRALLREMLHDDLIEEKQGDEGALYIPNRKHSRRMAEIKNSQLSSNDPLWLTASSFD
ncbi:hypothetical protein ACQ4OD_17385 [Pseudomonas sp. WC1]|uniref:hypothetical protein n=1 Tax=Pseudomonas sp. WC1 TaxID=3424772 RepID=UPI003D3324C9